MAESNQGQGNQGQGKEMKVSVAVDNEAMKTLIETQKRLEEDKKRLEAEKQAAEDAKKKAEDEAKKSADEAKELTEKLSLIAQKEFEKKKTDTLAQLKPLIPDETRYNEISSKLTDPEQLQATEYMVKILKETIAKGEESHIKMLEEERKKTKEAEEKLTKGGTASPSGTAPLNTAQLNTGGAVGGTKYSSYEAMIADLRKKEHSPNPEIAAMAKAAITDLTRKWAMAVKAEAKEMREFTAEPKNQKTLAEIVQHERAKRQAMLNDEKGD